MAIKMMPHNLDAENALLGCILIDDEIQFYVLEDLQEEDFYDRNNQLILLAMKSIYGSRRTVDIVTVSEELERTGKLSQADGMSYLIELTQSTPSSANYQEYFDIVHRNSIGRKLIRAANKIIESSQAISDERESISLAEKLIYDISAQKDRRGFLGMADGVALDKVLHRFELLQSDPDCLRGVPTGFRQLDRLINGLNPSHIIILAARPGVGKTAFAMNIVEHAVMQRKKVCAVFSLEMSDIEMLQRHICSYSGVSMERALSGQLDQRDWKKLMLASDKMKRESKLFIDTSMDNNPQEILSKCRRLKSQEGSLDLIVIDYLQLMKGMGSKKEESRNNEIGDISRGLKKLAKELDIPVLLLSQLKRIENREPTASDLRDSGNIEQDADAVLLLHRPEAIGIQPPNGVKGSTELIVAKNRHGAQGRIQLRFIGELTKFIEVHEQGVPEEEPQFYKKIK